VNSFEFARVSLDDDARLSPTDANGGKRLDGKESGKTFALRNGFATFRESKEGFSKCFVQRRIREKNATTFSDFSNDDTVEGISTSKIRERRNRNGLNATRRGRKIVSFRNGLIRLRTSKRSEFADFARFQVGRRDDSRSTKRRRTLRFEFAD